MRKICLVYYRKYLFFFLFIFFGSLHADSTSSPSKPENHIQDVTKVVMPNATYATILISTLPANPNTIIPSYLNPNVDNGKLVAGGTLLANNICAWKIGSLNPANGKFKPLAAGTKLTNINADNYFPDSKGTTAFCGNVSVAGDLTVTGTLSSNDGHFCIPSDVALQPANTLLVNNINPVKMVGGDCVADDSTCAFTKFSGGIDIHGRRVGMIPNVTLTGTPLRVLGLQFDSNIYDCPTSTPVAVKIHFMGYGSDDYDDCFSVCFTQDVAISPDLYSGDTSICALSDPITCTSGQDCSSDVVLTAVREGDLYDQNPEIFLELSLSNF